MFELKKQSGNRQKWNVKLVAGGSAELRCVGCTCLVLHRPSVQRRLCHESVSSVENYEAAIFVPASSHRTGCSISDQGNVNLPSDPDEQEARRIFPKDMSYICVDSRVE